MSAVVISHELKGYESQLKKAAAEAAVLKSAMAEAQRKYTAAQQHVTSLEARIAELKAGSAEPIVSEHAILRWLQRVDGVDLDQIRARILDGGTSASIKFAKSGRIAKAGVTLVVKNNTVVTVE